MNPRRPIIGGNWKMNTDRAGAATLAQGVADALNADGSLSGADVALFPPFPYLLAVGEVLRRAAPTVMLGAQDFYPAPNGAFTGEVSLAMLADCGVSVLLAGHSERRHVLGESDETINAKVLAALDPARAAPGQEFTCILCVGETLAEREAGETDAVNERQLRAGLKGVPADRMSRLVVAYEPVWAIGTGKTATPDDARNAHAHIRRIVGELYGAPVADALRIQYGGSVKASNAAELFGQTGVDGGLIGGASLKSEEFCAIAKAAAAHSA